MPDEHTFCEQHGALLCQINKRIPIWVFLGSMGIIFGLMSLTFITLRTDIKNISAVIHKVDKKVVELDTKISIITYGKIHSNLR